MMMSHLIIRRKRFLSSRIKVKYIRQNHSGLPANARNRGIEIATGRLIALFDGDDIWYPNKLERCLEIFNKDSTIDILCHDLSLIRSSDGKTIKRTFFGALSR